MRDAFLDAMGGSRGKADYTLEEIEAAEKRKKKHGGSLQENLDAVTGRKPGTMRFDSVPVFEAAPAVGAAGAGSSAQVRTARAAGAAGTGSAVQGRTTQTDAMTAGTLPDISLDDQIRELKDHAAKDYGVGLSAFKGLEEELAGSVYGQEELIKKLVIAFKRPYVMPPEGKRALNCILLRGPEDSGKHFALRKLAECLKQRNILPSSDIRLMDLGLYSDASMEKLFLQDIYTALSGEGSILLFENMNACHPSFLTSLASLVTEGAFPLSERYILQKGQLVNVQNSLASQAVGELNARGKYLVFLTTASMEKTAGLMGAAFIDALGDICESGTPEEEALRRVAEEEEKDLKEKAERKCLFRITFAEGFREEALRRGEKGAGLRGIKDFYAEIYKALAQCRLESNEGEGAELTIEAGEGKLLAIRKKDGSSLDLRSFLPADYKGEMDTIRKELDAIIGLKEIKEYIGGLEEYYRVQKKREESGLKTGSVSKHMIFTGNPGTGKTTIARIISKYLKAIGVLSGGQLVEVSRADLVGRYVGHTAPLTNKVIESALGGVLFIDEAYSLYRGGDDSFGLEAIDTLVKGIEDHRDNLIVILAGYSHEMQEFLTANSGLKSRFPNVIEFPDYTGEELLQIAVSIAGSKGYAIDKEAHKTLCDYFHEIQLRHASDSGNGRLARNLVEGAILNQAKRLVAEPEADLSLLLAGDFDLESDS